MMRHDEYHAHQQIVFALKVYLNSFCHCNIMAKYALESFSFADDVSKYEGKLFGIERMRLKAFNKLPKFNGNFLDLKIN